MDVNNDGTLTYVEFNGMLMWLGLSFESSVIKQGMAALDNEGKGTIDYFELLNWLQEINQGTEKKAYIEKHGSAMSKRYEKG